MPNLDGFELKAIPHIILQGGQKLNELAP